MSLKLSRCCLLRARSPSSLRGAFARVTRASREERERERERDYWSTRHGRALLVESKPLFPPTLKEPGAGTLARGSTWCTNARGESRRRVYTRGNRPGSAKAGREAAGISRTKEEPTQCALRQNKPPLSLSLSLFGRENGSGPARTTSKGWHSKSQVRPTSQATGKTGWNFG